MRCWTRRHWYWIAWAFALGACDKVETVDARTQILLRINNTDTALRAKMTRLRVTLSLRSGDTWKERDLLELASAGLKWPVDIPITPSADSSIDRQLEIVVDALGGKTVLAQTRVLAKFVRDERRVLEVFLYVCPGHDVEDAYVCAAAGCRHDACEVCNLAGDCEAQSSKPTTAMAEDAGVGPENKPPFETDGQIAMDAGLGDIDGSDGTDHDAGTDAGGTLEPGAIPCDPGYQDDGAGGCKESECAGNTCGVGGKCVEGTGDYTCDCESGYSGDGTHACEDVDECGDDELAACGAGAIGCDNTAGSFECTCDVGYSGTGDTACEAIDDCQGTTVCDATFPCVDTTPYYACRGQFAEWTPSDSPAAAWFVTNGSVVTDTHTGLVWQKEADPIRYSWDEAKTHCPMAGLPGGGWRLPTRAELESIVDFTTANGVSAINQSVFPDTPRDAYTWTVSAVLGLANYAWVVNFYDGFSSVNPIPNPNYVRCVK